METQKQAVVIAPQTKGLFEVTHDTFFSSIVGDDRDTKAKVYNSMDTNVSLSDNLGVVLMVKDVIAHPVTLEDENTGEEIQQVRVVLITEDGNAYYAISVGVMSSLKNIMAIVGMPSWTDAIPMVPYETKSRKGFRVLKLRIAVLDSEAPAEDKPKSKK